MGGSGKSGIKSVEYAEGLGGGRMFGEVRTEVVEVAKSCREEDPGGLLMLLV